MEVSLFDCDVGDFIVGLLPRLVELNLPTFRDPAQVTAAIGQDLCEALASTPEDSAIFIAEGVGAGTYGCS